MRGTVGLPRPSLEAKRGGDVGAGRPAAPNGAGGVVLLHGLARTSASLRPLERALSRAGYATLALDYPSRRKNLQALAAEIGPPIAAFAAEQTGPIHFVTHSMGGLLARVYLAHQRLPRLGRVVMLGPPHDGSAVADLVCRSPIFDAIFGPAGQQLTTRYAADLRALCGPVDYELGIIAGTRSINWLASAFVLREPNDGKVAVRSTRLAAMTDHIALPVTHTFMMRNAAVVAFTLAFLRSGRFRESKSA